MMLVIKNLWKCLSSPRLFKIYRDGPLDAVYRPQGAEKWGDKILTSATTILNITIYTSPLICLYIYKRGFLSFDECKTLLTIFGGVGCFLAAALFMRTYGRATNPKYMDFLAALERPDKGSEAYLAAIRKYDFDFETWPVSFAMRSTIRPSWLTNPFTTQANANLPAYQRVVVQLLAFIAIHTFALRLIYPGSLSLIHSLLWMPLFQGRANLVETYGGKRSKIRTADGNFLDTMFVDNRQKTQNGNILVICCEGNSGFYEVGIMTSPIKTGYSALGWNHPGFAASTGLPYPDQEHNAIDAVVQFAISKLNFKPENIVMFGWSIGGYTASWAAVNYPVKGLILDATFDDLLPLAQKQMPDSWALLVKEVVRSYVNLNIAEVLRDYGGPLQLVRRTEDEIICLNPGHPASNRGNNLVVEILKQRHPDLVENRREEVVRYSNLLAIKRPTPDAMRLNDDLEALTRVSQYMRDYKSTHCTPLPDDFFASVMNSILHQKID